MLSMNIMSLGGNDMAICASQGRMYMGTARQYMEKTCGCQCDHSETQSQNYTCANKNSIKCDCDLNERLRHQENGCHPESKCVDLPLATAYMNPQPYTGLVNCDMAITRGSAFNNLYDPWNPGNRC